MAIQKLQERLAKLEEEIQREIEQSDGYWPPHIYQMIKEAQDLARKLH